MTCSVLLISIGGIPVDDYRMAFCDEGYELRSSSADAQALSLAIESDDDIAIVVGDGIDAALTMMPALAAHPRPIVCVLPNDADGEIALLEAGATLCLAPGATTTAILLAWTEKLLVLSRGPWPRDFDFDPVARRVRYGGALLPLRPIEFDILLHLAHQAGHPVGVAQLHRSLWPDQAPSARLVAVHMHNLRVALASAGAEAWLRTIPGAGYLLAPPPPKRRNTSRRRK